MDNSLANKHPELISEWSEKNYPLTPDTVTFGSNKVMWWKGSCGHEWQASIKARSSGENCPICSGARVAQGINDLATLKPTIAAEWSDKNKELKPTMVTVGSSKKVIWKGACGHEWVASIKSRTVNGTGCPYCSHNTILLLMKLRIQNILRRATTNGNQNKLQGGLYNERKEIPSMKQ